MLSLRHAVCMLHCSSYVLAQKYLFSFGDSYTATRFDVNGIQPSVNNPLGNPPWDYSRTYQNVEGVVTGGPNYVEWLVTQYNTSILQSYNFGSSGATIDDKVVGYSGPIDLQHQVDDYFMPHYGSPTTSKVAWKSDNTLFTFLFGINDIDGSYSTAPASTQVPKLMTSYFNAADRLYRAGARNFLFLNVPAYQNTPFVKRGGPGLVNEIAAYIKAFNDGLVKSANNFSSTHAGVSMEIYDFNSFMQNVVSNPSSYGFKDGTCEGAGYSQCIWWQNADLHCTSVFHRNWARDLANSGKMGNFAKQLNPRFPDAITNKTSTEAFCPTDNAETYTFPGGDTYLMMCQYGYLAPNSDLEQTTQPNFQACLQRCSKWNASNKNKCLGANFWQTRLTCYLKNSTAEPGFQDYDSGILLANPSISTSMSLPPPSSSLAPPSSKRTSVRTSSTFSTKTHVGFQYQTPKPSSTEHIGFAQAPVKPTTKTHVGFPA